MSLGVASDNVRIWLHSKLEKSWHGSHVAYALTKDVLQHIVEQWSTLDTTLKLRLLTALMAVKSSQLKTIDVQVTELIGLTREDADGWVKTIGEMVSTLLQPANPHINFSALSSAPGASSLLSTLQSQNLESVDYAPLEAPYLHNPPPSWSPKPNSHFTLKKSTPRWTKPKDSLTTSTDLRSSQVNPRSNLSSSGTMRSSLGLSSGGPSTSSGAHSGILSSGGNRPPGGSGPLAQPSRAYEPRRPFVPQAATASAGLMIIDQVAELQKKADEEKAEKEAKEKAKKEKKAAAEEKKRDIAIKKAQKEEQKAQKAEDTGASDLIGLLGGSKPKKVKKTSETPLEIQNATHVLPTPSPPITAQVASVLQGTTTTDNSTSVLAAFAELATTQPSKTEIPPIKPATLSNTAITSSGPLPFQNPSETRTSINAKPSATFGQGGLASFQTGIKPPPSLITSLSGALVKPSFVTTTAPPPPLTAPASLGLLDIATAAEGIRKPSVPPSSLPTPITAAPSQAPTPGASNMMRPAGLTGFQPTNIPGSGLAGFSPLAPPLTARPTPLTMPSMTVTGGMSLPSTFPTQAPRPASLSTTTTPSMPNSASIVSSLSNYIAQAPSSIPLPASSPPTFPSTSTTNPTSSNPPPQSQ